MLVAVIGALALLAAYLMACHVATVQQSAWAPWLYFAPVLAMVTSSVARRWGGVWACALAVLMLGLMAWALSQWHGDLNRLFFIQHICTNLAFGWMFAHTLAAGKEPLVTRLARVVRRGDMPPQVLSFTRGVTLAWALFFAGVAMVSTVLYLGASIQAWSTFANLINSPLIGLMFVGEYAVRRYKLRGLHHSSFLGSIQAFRHHERR